MRRTKSDHDRIVSDRLRRFWLRAVYEEIWEGGMGRSCFEWIWVGKIGRGNFDKWIWMGLGGGGENWRVEINWGAGGDFGVDFWPRPLWRADRWFVFSLNTGRRCWRHLNFDLLADVTQNMSIDWILSKFFWYLCFKVVFNICVSIRVLRLLFVSPAPPHLKKETNEQEIRISWNSRIASFHACSVFRPSKIR